MHKRRHRNHPQQPRHKDLTSNSNNEYERNKIREINNALLCDDLERLRLLSLTPAGFVNDGIRRRVWPSLLRINISRKSLLLSSRQGHNYPSSILKLSLDVYSTSLFYLLLCVGFVDENHRDKHQVKLDVDRSFVNFPSSDFHPMEKQEKQKQLSNVINAVISKHPFLSYYQGFHDVCSVLVLVLGEYNAFLVAERLALVFLRDAMAPSLDHILKHLSMIFILLKQHDSKLHALLKNVNMLPYFSIGWVITWFSHNLHSIDLITRIFDFLLSFNPLMPIYMSTMILMIRRESIFELKVEDEVEYQPFIQNIPRDLQSMDPVLFKGWKDLQIIEYIITQSWDLFQSYPPSHLLSTHPLDPYSCVNMFTNNFKLLNTIPEPLKSKEIGDDKEDYCFDYQVGLLANFIQKHPLRSDFKDDQKQMNQNKQLRYTLLTATVSITSFIFWYFTSYSYSQQ